MLDENRGNFLVKFKEKATEYGIEAKQEFYEFVCDSLQLFPSIIGNELVLATFVPMIPSLIFDQVKQEILKKHMPDLAERLSNEYSQLNEEYIRTPEGQKIFKDTVKQILDETRNEKIEYLKKFLIVSYTLKNPNSEKISKNFKILVNMDPIHIKLLYILRNPKEIILQVSEMCKQNPRPVGTSPYGKHDHAIFWDENGKDDLNKYYLTSDSSVYASACYDLVIWGILEHKIRKFWIYFDSNFESNLETQIREIQQEVTLYGKQFIEYIYDD